MTIAHEELPHIKKFIAEKKKTQPQRFAAFGLAIRMIVSENVMPSGSGVGYIYYQDGSWISRDSTYDYFFSYHARDKAPVLISDMYTHPELKNLSLGMTIFSEVDVEMVVGMATLMLSQFVRAYYFIHKSPEEVAYAFTDFAYSLQ